jgi:hypothetical protein
VSHEKSGRLLYRGETILDPLDRQRKVAAQCEHELRPLFGTRREGKRLVTAIPLRLESDDRVPSAEKRAQAAFGKARRALLGLLEVTRGVETCGPCTAYVNGRRRELERLVAGDPEWKKRHRWRRHSADADSIITWVVDTFGGRRETANGRERRVTAKEMGLVALYNGYPLVGSSVAGCVRAATNAVHQAIARRRVVPRKIRLRGQNAHA